MGRFEDLGKGILPHNPFIKVEKDEKIKPLYKIDEQINTERRYVITKATDHGRFVRNGLLYFNMKGIEIYTDLNNAIFVDEINDSVTVKDYENALDAITPDEDPELRQYVIMMYCDDDVEAMGYSKYNWASMTGRSMMYDYIKDNIDIMYMNPDKSFILTANVPLKDALSVTQFVDYLKNGNLVPEDNFDIHDYIVDDVEEDES